ncbi:hypothetical protein ACGFNU_31990 [Spirillospora sp. NPDC048911]|uniref:hypothetical protein n=1 Tax=Spirillospora sp. NPDC048911 TaxID=3364527 RepID=UPI003720F9D9
MLPAPAIASDPEPTPTRTEEPEGKLSISVVATDASAKAGTQVAVTATLSATGGTVAKARITGASATGGTVSGQCRTGCTLGRLTDSQTVTFVVSAPSDIRKARVVTLRVSAASSTGTASDSASVSFVPKIVQLPGKPGGGGSKTNPSTPKKTKPPVKLPPSKTPKTPLPNTKPQSLPFQRLPGNGVQLPQVSPVQTPQVAQQTSLGPTARLTGATDDAVDAFGLLASAQSAWLTVLLAAVIAVFYRARRPLKLAVAPTLRRKPKPARQTPAKPHLPSLPKRRERRSGPRSFLGFSIRLR